MTKKLLFGLIAITLVALVAVPLCSSSCVPTAAPPAKDKIVIGASRSLSGPNSVFEEFAFGPIYKMWADEVNADGGIYVKDYGKKLPVEMKVYDDTSDPGMVARNIEKLCVEDNVDFLFGPCGTALLFAAAPIANKYEKIILCAEGGCTTLTPMLPDLPYVFSVLNFSDHYQMPVLAELLDGWGAKTAYFVYLADLHGAEYNHVAQSEFTKKNITILASKSIPADIKDLDPIIKEAKALDPDVFCVFAYVDQIMLATGTAIALDFNPKAFVLGPGGNFQFFLDAFGPAAEGVIGEGAWNRKSSPGAAEFTEKFVARMGEAGMAAFGDEEAFVDWWGALVYYGALEHFKQSIEKAGTLDSKTVRDVMATETFDTCLGPMSWMTYDHGGALLPYESYAGQIGQWQSGIFEVIDPGEKRTAEPIYPKPPWPAPPG